jgi:hypothetical protein
MLYKSNDIRPSKKMFWFSDNGFQKKGKVGRVFIFCFHFQSNMGKVFIFCFYFQRFENITQTSSILLFWRTNDTIMFTLSTGRIVHGTICLERNCTLKLMRTVFSKQIVPWTILPVDRVNIIVSFVRQNSRIELVCVMFSNR